MKKIFWTNATKSGLCDRLQDLFLMSAYASLKDCSLYLYWPQGNKDLSFNKFQLDTWPNSRWSDYLKENLCSYFSLPENIHFLPENCLDNTGETWHFNDYLGGIFSRKTFAERYGLNKNEFYKFHDKALSEFVAKDKLTKLVNKESRIDLSVHLRRTDKINSNPNFVEIHLEELRSLDDMTEECVLREIKLSNRKLNVHVCSDCPEAKAKFIGKICGKCNIVEPPSANQDYEQTYLDLYLLSQSKKIIMSQKHSNFSFFASSLNKSELIYFYSDNKLINNSDHSRFKLFSRKV
jgi:hypothetical protein